MTLEKVKAVINTRRKVYLTKQEKWSGRDDDIYGEELIKIDHTLTALDYLEMEMERAFLTPAA